MTKQYFSTLSKWVSVSSLIGMVVMLLVVACSAPDGGDGGGGSTGSTPPTPPVLGNVAPMNDGGVEIEFTESSDLYFTHTLITAKSKDGGHEITATVPRGNTDPVTLYGLKAGSGYNIILQAVSRDGTPSVITDDNKEDVTKSVVVTQLTPEAKEARKANFFSLKKDDGDTEDNQAKIVAVINKQLGIVPKLDKKTSATSIKVVLTTIPSLAGIVKIEVLAVAADVASDEEAIETASKDDEKSVLKEVETPESGADVLLEGLKVAGAGSNEGKVKVFYRLFDVNGVVSDWISTGDAVKPVKLEAEIKDLKVTKGNQSITAITWEPVTGYKTFIQIVNTDTGRKIAEHTFSVGTKGIVIFPPSFIALKGKLYGKSTYEVTAKAVKDGISTEGVSEEVTVEDTIGPSGKKSPDSLSVDIVLTIKKVGGRTLEVGIDAQPFEPDYAKTVIGVFVKEEGTVTDADATEYKVITLHKGTMSEQFEGDKNGVYTAVPIFYDIAGNPSSGPVTLAMIKNVSPVTLAASNKKPIVVGVKIKASPTATPSRINDGQVKVTWEIADESKANQVKEWTVTPLQYVKAGTGSATHVSAKAKTVKGTKRGVMFYGLELDKQYLFEVKGKDNWDLDIGAEETAEPKLALKARTPADIGIGGANIAVPTEVKGTLRFTKGNSLDSGKNATDIVVTLKKGGTVVKGYNKKLYGADADIILVAGTYTAELQAYSDVTGKYSAKTKIISSGLVTVFKHSPTTNAALKAAITDEIKAQDTNSPNLNIIDTSAVTDMSNVFENNKTFNGDISSWDTRQVTTMRSVFYGASAFNGDISSWDTRQVATMYGMFYNANKFNGDISSWDTRQVATMKFMFYGASAFNGDISSWDTRQVATMYGMFYNANKFNRDISSWDTRQVTTMEFMFYGTSSKFNGDISGWDTRQVTSMGSMFSGASAFNGDISSWDTRQVTSMKAMFYGASAFNGDISKWKTGKVTTMHQMFMKASKFNGDISKWDTRQVTSMYAMFYNANKFNGDISSWDTRQVTTMEFMFMKASAFNGDILGWNTNKVTSMGSMFSGASAFDQNLTAWKVPGDADKTNMFRRSKVTKSNKWPTNWCTDACL